MLQIAWSKQEVGEPASFSEVLIKYYGWKPKTNGHFNKSEIGSTRYMSCKMAIRKSALRLEERGLIYIQSRSKLFSLTSKGVVFANNGLTFSIVKDGQISIDPDPIKLVILHLQAW